MIGPARTAALLVTLAAGACARPADRHVPPDRLAGHYTFDLVLPSGRIWDATMTLGDSADRLTGDLWLSTFVLYEVDSVIPEPTGIRFVAAEGCPWPPCRPRLPPRRLVLQLTFDGNRFGGWAAFRHGMRQFLVRRGVRSPPPR